MKLTLQYAHKQRGVALIIALIITTIALVLASAVVYRQQLHIRLTGNIASLEQAYQYATGMEDWAGTILETDYEDNPAIDSLDEDWATLLPLIPIPGGSMNGQLFDLQARINLNSLARKPPSTKPQSQQNLNENEDDENNIQKNRPSNQKTEKKPAPDIAQITRRRIDMIIKKIDPDENMGPSENFADILKDWIDEDQYNGNKAAGNNGTGSGAESPHYQSLEFPYYSASTLLASPSELRLLKDMTDEVYSKLLPLINTLPIEDDNKPLETPINVNTASKDLLEAIGFSSQEADSIISFREDHKEPEKQAFKDKQEFLDFPDIQDALTSTQPNVAPAVDKDDLDVKSNFFLLQGTVKINNTRLFINSILYRKKGQVSVIMRDFSNPQSFIRKSDDNSTL